MARRLHRDVQGNLVEAESVESKAAEATNPKAAEAINPKAAEATKTGDQNGNGPLQAVQDTGMSNNAHVRDVCNHKGKDMGFSIFLSCRPCLGSVGVCFSGGRGGGPSPPVLPGQSRRTYTDNVFIFKVHFGNEHIQKLEVCQ